MAAARPDNVQACGDCRFWNKKDNPIFGQPPQGTCHRYPPSVSTILIPQGQSGLQLTNIAAPPVTAAEFGCGEWQQSEAFVASQAKENEG